MNTFCLNWLTPPKIQVLHSLKHATKQLNHRVIHKFINYWLNLFRGFKKSKERGVKNAADFKNQAAFLGLTGWKLLTNTKAAENLAQQIITGEFTGDFI